MSELKPIYPIEQIVESIPFYREEAEKFGRVDTPYGTGYSSPWAHLMEAARMLEQLLAERAPQAGEAEPVKCQHCNGTGEIEPDNNGPIGPCPMCNGKGSYIPRTAPPRPVAPHPSVGLIHALMCQKQCDEDGVEVRVSRQALDEAIEILRALPPSPVGPEPMPEGMCRAAMLWVLWHHQGGSSDVGQPIRFALGMGAHEPLSAEQVEAAKSYGALTKKWPPDSPGAGDL